MSNRPIHYEPHPVSRERKAELIAAGFRIVDAKFKPKIGFHKELAGGGVGAGQEADDRAWRVSVNEQPAGLMTVEQLKTSLTAKGITFRSNASRASLVALLTKEA